MENRVAAIRRAGLLRNKSEVSWSGAVAEILLDQPEQLLIPHVCEFLLHQEPQHKEQREMDVWPSWEMGLPYVRNHCRLAIWAKGFGKLINLSFSCLSASAIQMLPEIWSGFCLWCWQRGDRNLRDIQMQLSSALGDTGQKVGESCFPGAWTMLSPELMFWVLPVKTLALNTDPVYSWHESPFQVRLLELCVLQDLILISQSSTAILLVFWFVCLFFKKALEKNKKKEQEKEKRNLYKWWYFFYFSFISLQVSSLPDLIVM